MTLALLIQVFPLRRKTKREERQLGTNIPLVIAGFVKDLKLPIMVSFRLLVAGLIAGKCSAFFATQPQARITLTR
jgi:hypothetical protein